jgi:hypothetical protein
MSIHIRRHRLPRLLAVVGLTGLTLGVGRPVATHAAATQTTIAYLLT